MRVTRRQLRQLIREAIEEDKSGKGECPPDGCVQKRGKGWVVISNKTGECWGRSKREGGECTYYDTKKAAQSALKAYHMEESVMRITKRQLRQLIREAAEEGIETRIETRERIGFHGLMDILGISSGDTFGGEWNYDVWVKSPTDGETYSVYIRDHGDGTWDVNGPVSIFASHDKNSGELAAAYGEDDTRAVDETLSLGKKAVR